MDDSDQIHLLGDDIRDRKICPNSKPYTVRAQILTNTSSASMLTNTLWVCKIKYTSELDFGKGKKGKSRSQYLRQDICPVDYVHFM